eukprot:Skav204656  [mRNA]  locus=scaffold949:158469:158840:+ [translate_table: standard]
MAISPFLTSAPMGSIQADPRTQGRHPWYPSLGAGRAMLTAAQVGARWAMPGDSPGSGTLRGFSTAWPSGPVLSRGGGPRPGTWHVVGIHRGGEVFVAAALLDHVLVHPKNGWVINDELMAYYG